MKRTLLALLLITACIVVSSAQDKSYKIFEKKRGTAYQPSLVGADEKYIYVFTSGISESAQYRNTDALLNTYSISDFTPIKTKKTDLTYKGKQLSGATPHVFGKYVILIYREYDKKAKVGSLTWLALDRETLEPVKDGVLGKNKLKALDIVTVDVSPDGQVMMILYGDKKKEFIAAFDKDMTLQWESNFSIPDNCASTSQHIDDNQSIYVLLIKTLSKEEIKRGINSIYQIMTLKDKATSNDLKAVGLSDDKSIFCLGMAVSGEGALYMGGLYSNASSISPNGVFTLKIDPNGSKVSDSREMPHLNKKSTFWRIGAGVTDKGEFYFHSSNTSILQMNSYSSSGAPSGGYSSYVLDGYVAVFANTSGKINHAMNWNHFPIPFPDAPVSIAPIIENGKPYLFTDYSKQQMDKWGNTDYSKVIPAEKETIKSPTRQICSVSNLDAPAANKPTPLFTIDKSFFGCSNATYVPSLHTMVFFGCVTEGKYGQGYTNFWLGKTVLK